MSKATDQIASALRGKKILIWGLGREGRATYQFIRRHLGAQPVTLCDFAPPDLSAFDHADFIPDDPDTDFSPYDIIMKSPGISVLGKSPAVKAKLSGETALFFEAFRSQIIGVTGTKGKSTTSSLIYHVLKAVYPDTVLVGNIGIPCFELADQIEPSAHIVFELSCHQLEFTAASPHIGVVLNLFEEHLDHYGSYPAYVAAKNNILKYQLPGDTAVVGLDALPQLTPAPGARVITSAMLPGAAAGSAAPCLADITAAPAAAPGEYLLRGPRGSFALTPGRTLLLGLHNAYNIAVARYICCGLCGVSTADFDLQLAGFQGLAHRLQLVGCYNGVTYYDDSISTICAAAISAVRTLQNVGSLLLGGMDRGIDYTELVDFLAGADLDHVILMPDTASRIADQLLVRLDGRARPAVHMSTGLANAVAIAKQVTPKGKICLLSPAAASYGFFKNFEERGDEFQRLVRSGS